MNALRHTPETAFLSTHPALLSKPVREADSRARIRRDAARAVAVEPETGRLSVGMAVAVAAVLIASSALAQEHDALGVRAVGDGAYLLQEIQGFQSAGTEGRSRDAGPVGLGHSVRNAVFAAFAPDASGEQEVAATPHAPNPEPVGYAGLTFGIDEPEAEEANRDRARGLMAAPLARARQALRGDVARFAQQKAGQFGLTAHLSERLEGLERELLPEAESGRARFQEATGIDVDWSPLRPTRATVEMRPLQNIESLSPALRDLDVTGHLSPEGNSVEARWRFNDLSLSGRLNAQEQEGGSGQLRAAYRLSDNASAEARGGSDGAALMFNYGRAF